LGFFIKIWFYEWIFVYLHYMKKYTFILALGVAFTLTACGSGSTANQTTDSLSAQVDTAAVSADSTTAQIPADSSVVK
jgi:ABC-type enterochelin transport system substrate-binding protein